MNDARRMLACLANERVAKLFAAVVLGRPEALASAAPRQQRDIDLLVSSGLLRRGDQDQLELDVEGIKEILARGAGPRPEREDKWLDKDGRIRAYPRNSKERVVLLARVGENILADDERIAEPELNRRLQRFSDDVPTLRRYLIVHGVLTRERDGSLYWRDKRADL